MNDLPGRQQQDRGLIAAVCLVVDPHSIAVEEPVEVGITRPGLFMASGARRVSMTRGRRYQMIRADHGRASNTALNGVSATRRKRVNPPASTTSAIRASPA